MAELRVYSVDYEYLDDTILKHLSGPEILTLPVGTVVSYTEIDNLTTVRYDKIAICNGIENPAAITFSDPYYSRADGQPFVYSSYPTDVTLQPGINTVFAVKMPIRSPSLNNTPDLRRVEKEKATAYKKEAIKLYGFENWKSAPFTPDATEYRYPDDLSYTFKDNYLYHVTFEYKKPIVTHTVRVWHRDADSNKLLQPGADTFTVEHTHSLLVNSKRFTGYTAQLASYNITGASGITTDFDYTFYYDKDVPDKKEHTITVWYKDKDTNEDLQPSADTFKVEDKKDITLSAKDFSGFTPEKKTDSLSNVTKDAEYTFFYKKDAPLPPTTDEKTSAEPKEPEASAPEEADIEKGNETVGEGGIPLFGFDKICWALLNLIMMIGSIILSVIMVFRLMGKSKKSKETNSDESYEYQKSQRKHNDVMGIIAALTGVLSLIAFLLTENIRLPLVFIDEWTLLMAVLLGVQLFAIHFFNKKKREQTTEPNELMM